MTFWKFLDLATEVQIHVLRQCETADILRLACASKTLNSLAMPVLYEYVDLSYHNDAGYFLDLVQSHDRMVLGNNPERFAMDICDGLKRKQESFIDTLHNSPELGRHVTSLTWTYQAIWEDFDEFHERLWWTFQQLNHVKNIDICSLDNHHQLLMPPPLFQTATNIKISGILSYTFFKSLVSCPERIESLYLDNVQGVGQESNGVGLDFEGETAGVLETVDEADNPSRRISGPMLGHLKTLQGRCHRLRKFSVSSVGQDDWPDWRWSRVREQERAEGLMDFIDTIRPTLIELALIYGTVPDKPYRKNPRGPVGWKAHVGRPMDGIFANHILPRLISGSWPRLKSIAIRGIGGQPTQEGLACYYTPEHPEVFQRMRDDLMRAFGKNLQLQWKEESNETFYLMEPDGCGWNEA